jgi:hypothetical protein
MNNIKLRNFNFNENILYFCDGNERFSLNYVLINDNLLIITKKLHPINNDSNFFRCNIPLEKIRNKKNQKLKFVNEEKNYLLVFNSKKYIYYLKHNGFFSSE